METGIQFIFMELMVENFLENLEKQASVAAFVPFFTIDPLFCVACAISNSRDTRHHCAGVS
jgi:hypothetical protein